MLSGPPRLWRWRLVMRPVLLEERRVVFDTVLAPLGTGNEDIIDVCAECPIIFSFAVMAHRVDQRDIGFSHVGIAKIAAGIV